MATPPAQCVHSLALDLAIFDAKFRKCSPVQSHFIYLIIFHSSHFMIILFVFSPPYEQAEPLKVCVTGAAGQIAYSLLYSLASGDVFGKDQVS